MFEENLINAIEKHRCIWDKSLLCYRDKNKKDMAWRDVSAVVGESEADCRKRWKSLRDRFTIELKLQHQPSGSATSFRKNWAYFDTLSFLKGTVAPRNTTTNITTEIEDSGSSFAFDFNESGNLVLNSQTEDSEPVPPKRKKRNEDQDSSLNSLVED
ncbi:transcription factor Adf-1-like, partial [Rhagoletis pomonella]|uniref:transcription factor Adf-1-like n=1 Tax=Rhagoletis pomonella TaxID=28610 RepID=UPI00177E1AFD